MLGVENHHFSLVFWAPSTCYITLPFTPENGPGAMPGRICQALLQYNPFRNPSKLWGMFFGIFVIQFSRIPSGPPASNRHGGQNSGISKGLGGVCQEGPTILQNPEKKCLFLGNFSQIY